MLIADKATAPATETAEAATVTTEQTPAAGQAVSAPAPEVTALQQELERERKSRIESERMYANLRPKLNEHDQELAQLRAFRDSVFAGQGEDTSAAPAVDPEMAREVLATREEVAWMRFQQNHPKYTEYWDEMKEIAGDPVYKRTIESFRVVHGQPVLDTFSTLHNAYNEVMIRRMNKAQAETATRRTDAAATTRKLVSQATISGEGAGSADQGGGGGLTLAQIMAMDYNDLIKHPEFAPYTDPNDPPRGI